MALTKEEQLSFISMTFYDNSLPEKKDKAFDIVLHGILVAKLQEKKKKGFDGWTSHWIRIWLDGYIQSQRVADQGPNGE